MYTEGESTFPSVVYESKWNRFRAVYVENTAPLLYNRISRIYFKIIQNYNTYIYIYRCRNTQDIKFLESLKKIKQCKTIYKMRKIVRLRK